MMGPASGGLQVFTLLRKARNGVGYSGTPWSGQAVNWNCRTSRFSLEPFWNESNCLYSKSYGLYRDTSSPSSSNAWFNCSSTLQVMLGWHETVVHVIMCSSIALWHQNVFYIVFRHRQESQEHVCRIGDFVKKRERHQCPASSTASIYFSSWTSLKGGFAFQCRCCFNRGSLWINE